MIIKPNHRKIILNLRDPTKVLNLLPTARPLEYKGRTLTVVPHRLPEVKLLQNIGIDAPHPIDYYYSWPIRQGWTPMEHQKDTARFLSRSPRAYCLNGLGTGKTMSALWSFDFLRHEGLARKLLVVSPLSTIERTWADEIFWHFPHLRSVVLHGSREQRRKLLAQDVDVYIINHDGVKVILDDLVGADFDVVLIDELSQAARNASTDRWKAYKALVKDRSMVWGMTGTPIPNAPTDAWAQCRLITPSTVPPYFGHFRDRVMRQVTEFKWVPREGALEMVHQAMQPAIRYKREDVLADLPPVMYETRQAELTKEQARMFKEMADQLYTQSKGQGITAVNEGVKAMKLVQIACVAEGVLVMTTRGWVPIEQITPTDWIWDGVEWVSHQGLVRRGKRKTVECFGVRMTPDHEVLTTRGWATAGEVLHADASEGFDREEVRVPDGYSERGYDRPERGKPVRNMVVPLRLWERGYPGESASALEIPYESEALRVQVWDRRDDARERNAQDGKVAPIPGMDEHEATVHGLGRQRLEELRRAWNTGVRTMVRVVRELLGRYGANLPAWAYAGAAGQRGGLFAGELSVGDDEAAGEQHTPQRLYRYAEGPHDGIAGRRSLWGQGSDVGTAAAGRLGRGRSIDRTWEELRAGTQHPERAYEPEPGGSRVRGSSHDAEGSSKTDERRSRADDPTWEETFDIAYCGPRSRFVVRDRDGGLLIVHNCGCAYGDEEDERVVAPPKHRLLALREVIEEAESKVIVFVPFRAALDLVADVLFKGYTVGKIHGGVSKADRDDIFKGFQHGTDPHILVAQPAAMSHGLTLTAASCIVWFAPVTSAETYEQANARITRPGQKCNQLIVHLQGTDLEARMYERLKHKTTMQGVLLDMFKKTA